MKLINTSNSKNCKSRRISFKIKESRPNKNNHITGCVIQKNSLKVVNENISKFLNVDKNCRKNCAERGFRNFDMFCKYCTTKYVWSDLINQTDEIDNANDRMSVAYRVQELVDKRLYWADFKMPEFPLFLSHDLIRPENTRHFLW